MATDTKSKTKLISITGAPSEDITVRLDVSNYATTGSLSFTEAKTKPTQKLDDTITVQGLKGVVSKIGTVASASLQGSSVSATLGNFSSKKMVGVYKPENDATFQSYLLSDIVSDINTLGIVNVTYQGTDLCVESYSYTGKIIDCLNDIAGLVYGTLIYDSSNDQYIIVSGDTTYSSKTTSSYSIAVTDLISCEITDERNNKLLAFGTDIVNAAKTIATVRASILDLTAATVPVATSNPKVITNEIKFSFGSKGAPGTGVTAIPNEVYIDGATGGLDTYFGNATAWQTWTVGAKGAEPPASNRYFKTEVVTQYDPKNQTNGTSRGLLTIEGCTLSYPLKNISNSMLLYGRGYTANLTTVGLPSITDFNALSKTLSTSVAGKGSGITVDSNAVLTGAYYALPDVQYRQVITASDTSGTLFEINYEPFLNFTVNTDLLNAVKAAGDDNGDLLVGQFFDVHLEIMGISMTDNLKYVGTLDKHNRLISPTGQVLLILVDSYFYGPMTGCDMSFIPTNSKVTALPGFSDLADGYFNESSLKQQLLDAYEVLKGIVSAQTPIGQWATTTNTTYPRFITAYTGPPDKAQVVTSTSKPPPKANAAVLIGMATLSNDAVDTGTKEAKLPLTLTEYNTSNRQLKLLNRKLKCLESKITLICKCIKKNDPTNTTSVTTVKTLMQTIVTYNTLTASVKDPSLVSSQTIKKPYDDAINTILQSFDIYSKAVLRRATLSVILPATLPTIGAKFTVPSGYDPNNSTYIVTGASVSGLNATITGECNV